VDEVQFLTRQGKIKGYMSRRPIARLTLFMAKTNGSQASSMRGKSFTSTDRNRSALSSCRCPGRPDLNTEVASHQGIDDMQVVRPGFVSPPK
jgi:hypothetical protein